MCWWRTPPSVFGCLWFCPRFEINHSDFDRQLPRWQMGGCACKQHHDHWPWSPVLWKGFRMLRAMGHMCVSLYACVSVCICGSVWVVCLCVHQGVGGGEYREEGGGGGHETHAYREGTRTGPQGSPGIRRASICLTDSYLFLTMFFILSWKIKKNRGFLGSVALRHYSQNFKERFKEWWNQWSHGSPRGDEKHLIYQEGIRKSNYRITSPFRRLFAPVWGEESLRTESVGRTGLVAECWPPVCLGGTTLGDAEVLILWFHIWEGTKTRNSKSGADLGKEVGVAKPGVPVHGKGSRGRWGIAWDIEPPWGTDCTATPTPPSCAPYHATVHHLACVYLCLWIFCPCAFRLSFTVFV